MALAPELAEELRLLLSAGRAHLEVEAELGLAHFPAGIVSQYAPVAAAVSVSASPAAAPQKAPEDAQTAHIGRPPAAASATPLEAAAPATGQGVVPAAAGARHLQLAQLAGEASTCTACVLHKSRTKSVFARGSESAELVFVGEGPGRDEDLSGAPFVGAAGQLLDRMVAAMGFGRDEIYVCNVVKCRPPENRTPRPEEMLACRRFLVPQLQLVAPKVIVALGRCAAQALGAAEASGSWRGRWSQWEGVPVMPTYHPAFLLRSPEWKRTVWEDLQLVMTKLGKTPPAKRA